MTLAGQRPSDQNERRDAMMRAIPKMAAFRAWKWLVGVIYIVLAVVLLVLGRITTFEAAVLLGLGIILV
jgi:hypothetical protein